jgi:hypothetical protein
MGYNTIDVNDYIALLSDITNVDKKEVYVIVMRNFMAISRGDITVSDAYCNISAELTYAANLKRENRYSNKNNKSLLTA